MKKFIDENFLLQTETTKRLYHHFARGMHLTDYHCHLPIADVANHRMFGNLTQVWLNLYICYNSAKTYFNF